MIVTRAKFVVKQAVSPVREVITMVEYSDMFLFASVITSVISLCYLMFSNK